MKALALAALMALPTGAATAQAPRGAATETPSPAACDACAVVPYGGQNWQIDPALGPVQGVVTKKVITAEGASLEGIVFLHDADGWRAAGTFSGIPLPAGMQDANVGAELTLAVAGQ